MDDKLYNEIVSDENLVYAQIFRRGVDLCDEFIDPVRVVLEAESLDRLGSVVEDEAGGDGLLRDIQTDVKREHKVPP